MRRSNPQVAWGLLRGWIRFAHHMVYTERSRVACARNDTRNKNRPQDLTPRAFSYFFSFSVSLGTTWYKSPTRP